MTDTKSMFASKNMWDGAIALIASVLSVFGIADISIGDQVLLTENIAEIVAAVGALIALWGRYSAKAVIE